MNKQQLYEKVNTQILASIEAGNLIWRKPWHCGLPANLVTKKVYQGINFLMLSLDKVSNPFYFTFLQAQQKNLRIKKGSKGREVVFWKIMSEIIQNEKSDKLKERKFPLLRFSYVFNLDDVDGYTPPEPTLQKPKDVLDDIIKTHTPNILPNLNRCYYSEPLNIISVPNVSFFTTEEEYFSSMFHELIHWTGHPSRLDRHSDHHKKDEYGFEELIAEIGGSYILGLCGIENLNNNAAYIDGWIKAAKLDNSYIPLAAAEAQKAVNFLLNIKSEVL